MCLAECRAAIPPKPWEMSRWRAQKHGVRFRHEGETRTGMCVGGNRVDLGRMRVGLDHSGRVGGDGGTAEAGGGSGVSASAGDGRGGVEQRADVREFSVLVGWTHGVGRGSGRVGRAAAVSGCGVECEKRTGGASFRVRAERARGRSGHIVDRRRGIAEADRCRGRRGETGAGESRDERSGAGDSSRRGRGAGAELFERRAGRYEEPACVFDGLEHGRAGGGGFADGRGATRVGQRSVGAAGAESGVEGAGKRADGSREAAAAGARVGRNRDRSGGTLAVLQSAHGAHAVSDSAAGVGDGGDFGCGDRAADRARGAAARVGRFGVSRRQDLRDSDRG
jgi:hypothetical protein